MVWLKPVGAGAEGTLWVCQLEPFQVSISGRSGDKFFLFHVPTATHEVAERHLIPNSDVETAPWGTAGADWALQRVPSQWTAVGFRAQAPTPSHHLPDRQATASGAVCCGRAAEDQAACAASGAIAAAARQRHRRTSRRATAGFRPDGMLGT